MSRKTPPLCRMHLVILASAVVLSTAFTQSPSFRFYAGGTYAPGVPTPDSILGFPAGSRAAHYDEVVRYLHAIALTSPRMKLFTMGETYEHRAMLLAVVSSEENIKNLDSCRANITALSDPRSTTEKAARSIIESTPVVAWIGYGIHGDELSSTDAALQVLYQLTAGIDEQTLQILHNVIVCIEPMENPDGRERALSQVQQWTGAVSATDAQSIQHTGIWPQGRGNHYFFDLNRDWFAQVHLESRARMNYVTQWHPQLLVDAHEMGAFDTYVFSPPRPPVNPNVSDVALKWWKIFAAEQGNALDKFGWSYYTREWVDEWYPGYGSSWPLYTDAVGILYEQAGTDGGSVKRPDGTTLTYREAVLHHFTSSIANLSTAARNRRELLSDYAEARSRSAAGPRQGTRAFLIDPTPAPSRTERVIDALIRQGIEVRVTQREFRATEAIGYWDENVRNVTLPAGTYIVPLQQPMGRLANTIMEFDPHMTTSVLQEERKTLEKEKETKMYDVTTWSLPVVYGLTAYRTSEIPYVPSDVVTSMSAPSGSIENDGATYGYLLDLRDDRSLHAVAGLLGKGYKLRAGRQEVEVGGRRFSRGSILIRLNENPPTLRADLSVITKETGIVLMGVNTALTSRGPDLGGNDFVLLKEPQTALVGGPEISTTGLGSLWFLLDYQFRMRTSILLAAQLANADLGKYNVLIMPSAHSTEGLMRVLGKPGLAKLQDWVTGGGTLIAIGNSAALAADTASALANTRLLQQVLKDKDLYARAAAWEKAALAPVVDSTLVWSDKRPAAEKAPGEKAAPVNEKELALLDQRARMFMPRGALLRVDLDREHWLAFGAGDKIPVYVYTPNAFVSKDPVQTPARFSDYERLRVSGLLWPEARERWAGTAYLTRESKGRGQIILFADDPYFRAFFGATERLFLNSVLLGPGFGTAASASW